MLTPPPFQVNFSLSGFLLQPVPRGDWDLFCTAADALQRLQDVQVHCANAILVDLLSTTKPLPDGVAPLPLAFYATSASNISIYIIHGTLTLKDGSTVATVYEYAGNLTDRKIGSSTGLDAEAQNLQGHVGKGSLFPYVSSYDSADVEMYWADSAALGGLA